MHLQQTKAESLKSGGPQYYFHDLTPVVRDFLRNKGVIPVVLQTPYGIAETTFVAVGKNSKQDEAGHPVPGKVGHDRIQHGIGEAIRKWYDLKTADFSRIDVDVEIHPDGHFIIAPTAIMWRKGKKSHEITKPDRPLSFHHDLQGRLWKDQIASVVAAEPQQAHWIRDQICKIAEDHVPGKEKHVHESDLARAGGALAKLGMQLGPLRVKHYDCVPSVFRFDHFPDYVCPVELKKRSSGFKYQQLRYKPLPRAVVLCIEHDLKNVKPHIDVVELKFLAEYLSKAA